MSYNTRRAPQEGVSAVGLRRNQQQGGPQNFTPRGQFGAQQRLQRPQGATPAANGNFQQNAPRTPAPVKAPPPVQAPPPQATVVAQPPPVPQQPTPPVDTNPEPMQQGEGEAGKRPFWMNKGKITKKERNRRKNERLSKLLQPKNAVMILNELVRSATYTATEVAQPPSAIKTYMATVLVDGTSHQGHGRSKMEAKNVAAENALRHIIKTRQFSALKQQPQQDQDGDAIKMETEEDGQPSMPWQHIASFALFKLLNSWGEDLPTGAQDSKAAGPKPNKPAKALPENAVHMNPLMLLNQMLPTAQFEELAATGTPPQIVFTMKCTVDGQSFIGSGPNKKNARKMAAFEVCHKVLGIQYPAETYTASQM